MSRFEQDPSGLSAAQLDRLNTMTPVRPGKPGGPYDADGNLTGTPFYNDRRWKAEDVDIMELYIASPTRIDNAIRAAENAEEARAKAEELANPEKGPVRRVPVDISGLARGAEATELAARKAARAAASEG